MQIRIGCLLVIFVLVISCSKTGKKVPNSMAFTPVLPSVSHIDFTNTIVENDTLNYYEFPFLYLGGGVSIGDINNDDLPDLYFTGNRVPNRLYLNKGNLEFEDITDTAGVDGDGRWYTGSTMADVNNDGYLDIYVGVSEVFGNSANQLFINNGDNTFTEKADEFGIADTSTSIQSTFFDYDNDGYLDLFVANYPIVQVSQGNWYYHSKMEENKPAESGHLYKNNGDGSFTDVTQEAGVQRFGLTLGVVAMDFDNDGFKDLYLSNDFNVPDYFYRNNGDGTFSEISKDITRHTAMFGMGVDAADFNNDGLQDILQVDMTAEDYKRAKTNMASMSPEAFYLAVELGFHYQYMQNTLQINNGLDSHGNPQFSDISSLAGMAKTDWSWGGIFADFDNDGLKDVFISNGVKRDVNNNDVNAAFAPSFLGEERKKDYTLLPSTPIANYAFQNRGDYTFENTTASWGLDEKGFSNGFAIADLDNDGDQDLVINNMNAPASLYENKTAGNNYLKIKLKGPAENPFGLGAKVKVQSGALSQFCELTLTRGYQSSMDPVMHFGLAGHEQVDSLTILWPNGQEQKLSDIKANQLLEVSMDANAAHITSEDFVSSSFIDITETSGIDFMHEEDAFDDFVFEPLLPHRYSQLGPALAVGDVNGDGLDDFFVGNGRGSVARMYVQQTSGHFETLSGPWEADNNFEDTGALLFDADSDGDLDLYVVSGDNRKLESPAYYQDRIYLNTKAGFVKGVEVLPQMGTSGLSVTAADYDNDGDMDVFVGGRILPGSYPHPTKSHIFRNEGGQDSALRFKDVSEELNPKFSKLGLITSALWDDFDQDGYTDLIVAGEWSPIRFFKNERGKTFRELTQDMGIDQKTGWWYGLEKVDMDSDGDMDYVVGNLGLNYKYKASDKAPFEVYANDFDENGTADIVLSYSKKGTKLPLRGRECSAQQVPAIKKRFQTFEAFAEADLVDIYGDFMLENSLHYEANTFAHYYIENQGDGNYTWTLLPNRSQFSSINDFVVFDYNGDTYPDLLTAGNLYTAEVETPRNDAGIGLVLTGGAELKAIPPQESGLFLTGQVRGMAPIGLGPTGKQGFLVAVNKNRLRLITLNRK